MKIITALFIFCVIVSGAFSFHVEQAHADVTYKICYCPKCTGNPEKPYILEKHDNGNATRAGIYSYGHMASNLDSDTLNQVKNLAVGFCIDITVAQGKKISSSLSVPIIPRLTPSPSPDLRTAPH